MQFASDATDDLAQPPLDPGMDVLIGDRQRELAALDLLEDLPERLGNVLRLVLRDDALLAEHADVRDRATDILPHHPHVEPDRGVERLQAQVRALREPPAPRHLLPALLRHTRSFDMSYPSSLASTVIPTNGRNPGSYQRGEADRPQVDTRAPRHALNEKGRRYAPFGCASHRDSSHSLRMTFCACVRPEPVVTAPAF